MLNKSKMLGLLLSVGSLASPLIAEANNAEPPIGGETTVRLDTAFVSALGNLHVTPAASGAARIYEHDGRVYAAFPVTTGSIDASATRAEIDHSGGLSLTAGTTMVTLTAFSIELNPKGSSMLTGLVTVNGALVGRIPLFDLSLVSAKIWAFNHFLDVGGVGLTLDVQAADALSGIFHTAIPTLPVGVAEVRTIVADNSGL